MSNSMYNVKWIQTQSQLENLVITDYETQAIDPEYDLTVAQTQTYELYVKYIIICNKLEDIYNQMLQPQKRILLRKLLDISLGRMLELRYDLVNIDMMEFSYNSYITEKYNLSPIDLEIKIPTYFRRERQAEIDYRRKFIENTLAKFGWLDEDEPMQPLTELDAIKIIQMHERARQGRLRAQFMKEIRLLKDKGRPDASKDKTDTGLIAAMRIQKVWRGYTARRKTRRKNIEEMILIGMIPPPNSNLPELMEQDDLLTLTRYDLQSKFKSEYEKALVDIKMEISTKESTKLSQRIADELRAWFKAFKERTGKLPEFPPEENGGSRHLISRQGVDSEVSRSSAHSSKESRRTKDKSKSPTKTADLAEESYNESGFKPSQSLFLHDIKSGIDEFNDMWREKDESCNFRQTHYKDIIYADKYIEVEQEIRQIVDEMMRQELDVLQEALDLDRAAKGRKGKKGGKKARRSGKKNKKKKEKDLTPDRTTESLFEELVMNGIIKKYPETFISTYYGDISYVARNGLNPTPGDIRQAIKEICILPLGSDTIRATAPCVRSVLICGPKGSGKKTLVRAICTEVGATLFDLTPENIVGKYPGKSGLIMLMHLVSKVSRLLQPSVIYMDGAEKPFMKKVPKGDKSDPKRLKKDLPKLIKNIGPEDKIMFIGTCNAPWDGDQKTLQLAFNRFILIPKPDYGALSQAWKISLSTVAGINNFDVSLMAKISDGYSIGSVVQCVREVLTCKRRLQLKVQPLTHAELIVALSAKEPIYHEEEEAFAGWWSKTPLGRRKQRSIELELEAKLEKENSSNKGKKK